MKAVPFAVTIVLALAANPGLPRAAPGGEACPADPAAVPRDPVRAEGIVVGSVSPERARAATAGVERRTGLKVSPDYADLPRVIVRVAGAHAASETLAAVVDGRTPRPGERVELLSRYRDPRSRCRFIPWTTGSAPAVS